MCLANNGEQVIGHCRHLGWVAWQMQEGNTVSSCLHLPMEGIVEQWARAGFQSLLLLLLLLGSPNTTKCLPVSKPVSPGAGVGATACLPRLGGTGRMSVWVTTGNQWPLPPNGNGVTNWEPNGRPVGEWERQWAGKVAPNSLGNYKVCRLSPEGGGGARRESRGNGQCSPQRELGLGA